MQKTIELSHPKINLARMYDSVRGDVKKYAKRERAKDLPTGVDFWDFDCKFGHSESEAKECHLAEISQHLTEAEKLGLTSVYIEVLAKPGIRTYKAESEDEEGHNESEE